MSECLTCPKCHQPMRELRVGDATIDRCEACYGIWVDADERLLAVQSRVADVVDIAPEDFVAGHDDITEIDCPSCGERMTSVRHPDQKHVRFETCPGCSGRYFDAGELRDLSRHTISDLVRSIFNRK